jgi:hypothetical protein
VLIITWHYGICVGRRNEKVNTSSLLFPNLFWTVRRESVLFGWFLAHKRTSTERTRHQTQTQVQFANFEIRFWVHTIARKVSSIQVLLCCKLRFGITALLKEAILKKGQIRNCFPQRSTCSEDGLREEKHYFCCPFFDKFKATYQWDAFCYFYMYRLSTIAVAPQILDLNFSGIENWLPAIKDEGIHPLRVSLIMEVTLWIFPWKLCALLIRRKSAQVWISLLTIVTCLLCCMHLGT